MGPSTPRGVDSVWATRLAGGEDDEGDDEEEEG